MSHRHIVTRATHSYIQIHAESLIQFATHDTEFKNLLVATILHNLPGFKTHTDDNVRNATPYSKYLLPNSRTAAERRTRWLLMELQTRPQKHVSTVARLHSWASRNQNPQAVVLGIIGLAIIGPTLGLVEKKKKKKSQLRVVVDARLHDNLSKTEFSELTQAATVGLIGNEIAAVNGDTNRLDPEMADWLFADHETKISSLTHDKLLALHHELTHEQLPHFAVIKNSNLRAVAIAPVVSDALCVGTTID